MTSLDPANLALYAGALLIAAGTPGPAVMALVARVLAKGSRGAFAFTAGVALGDIVWLTFAIAGLAAVVQSSLLLFMVIKYCGAAYLLYIAWTMWHRPPVPAADEVDGPDAAGEREPAPLRRLLGGLSLTMGNPKVMLFYTALLPNLLDIRDIGLVAYGELVATTACVLTLVFASYILLAARTRRIFTSRRAMTTVNRGAATVIAGAAVMVASK